jgi:hypothetical protein
MDAVFDRRSLLRFGVMLLAFCLVLGVVMVWVRDQTRKVPVENQLMLGDVVSKIDSVAVILRQDHQMIIQIRLSLDGLPLAGDSLGSASDTVNSWRVP